MNTKTNTAIATVAAEQPAASYEAKSIIIYKNDRPHITSDQEVRRGIMYDMDHPSDALDGKAHRAGGSVVRHMIHAEDRYAGHYLVSQLMDESKIYKASGDKPGASQKLDSKLIALRKELVNAYIDNGVADGPATAQIKIKELEVNAMAWAATVDEKAASMVAGRAGRG